MLRSLEKTDDGLRLYAFTARGIMIISILIALSTTMGVLGIVALQNTRIEAKHERILDESNKKLLVKLENVVANQRNALAEVRDAACRIKRYETLSGTTVLRIASKFKLISPAAQKDWRKDLELVADIPAAPQCSGKLPATQARSGAAADQSAAIPVLGRAPERPAANRRAGGKRKPSLVKSNSSPGPPAPAPPAQTQAPVPVHPSPPSGAGARGEGNLEEGLGELILNPAGHAPPGLQPDHRRGQNEER